MAVAKPSTAWEFCLDSERNLLSVKVGGQDGWRRREADKL